MGGEQAARPIPDEAGDDDSLTILRSIEEQGRQTLALVRTLLSLLLPKEGDREGPSLEDLLAALVAQQRDLVATTRSIQTDVRSIDDRLAERGIRAPSGRSNGEKAALRS